MSGYLFALGSAVFNGSFVAFMKIPSVAAADLHPVLFNAYVSLGVFLSSWLVVPFFGIVDASFGFTWYGFLAGGLFVFAGSFSFIAASAIGLSTGQGVWGGAAIVVSFLWGTLGPAPISAPVQSFSLSLVAIALLLGGVIGIVKCEDIGTAVTRHFSNSVPTEATARLNSVATTDDRTGASGSVEASSRLIGLSAALAVGVFGGSILAPASFAGDAYTGRRSLAFLPSFGIGALVVALATTVLWMSYQRAHGRAPPLQLRSTLWAGCLSGATWNAGNLCSIIAINFFEVPFGVAYP
jgi:hypothetical protein